jgi:hypothetical protein
MKYECKVKYIFEIHFAWLKYFAYALVLVMTMNYKQQYCRRLNLEKRVIHKLNFWTSLNMFIWTYSGGGAKFIKHFKGGRKL